MTTTSPTRTIARAHSQSAGHYNSDESPAPHSTGTGRFRLMLRVKSVTLKCCL